MSTIIDFIVTADTEILLFIQEHIRNPVLDAIMSFFSVIGNGGAVWIVISVLLLATSRYRRVGFDMVLSLAVCYVLNDFVIKSAVQRVRPFVQIEELEFMLGALSASSSWSFPSGHTSSSFAAAYVLTRGLGKKGALFYIPAFFIAVSRIYIGVHYPFDVIIGAAIGTLGSVGVYALSRKFIKFKRKSI